VSKIKQSNDGSKVIENKRICFRYSVSHINNSKVYNTLRMLQYISVCGTIRRTFEANNKETLLKLRSVFLGSVSYKGKR
jgi:hypothetical protein